MPPPTEKALQQLVIAIILRVDSGATLHLLAALYHNGNGEFVQPVVHSLWSHFLEPRGCIRRVLLRSRSMIF